MAALKQFEENYKIEAGKQEVAPPQEMWDKIASSLDAKKPAKRIMLFRIAAAAAILIGVLLSGILFMLPDTNDDKLLLSDSKEATSRSSSENEKTTSQNLEQASSKHKEEIKETTISDISSYKENISAFTAAGTSSAHIKTDSIYDVKEFSTKPIQLEKITHKPEVPFFTTNKVKVKTLIAQTSRDHWKERFNVNYFDSQNKAVESTTFNKERKFHICGSISPVYSFRQTGGSRNMIEPSFSANYSYQEKGVLYPGGGLNLNLQLNKKWSLESGVRYARLGQEVNNHINNEQFYSVTADFASSENSSLKQMSLYNSMGNIKQHRQASEYSSEILNTDNPQRLLLGFGAFNNYDDEKGQLEQLIDYIEVPITLRYSLLSRHVKISLATGLSTNWLISNNVYVLTNNERKKIGETEGLSSMSWSTHAGINLAIPLFGPLSFSMEPRINYFLSDINLDYPVKFKPYSFGIYSGIQYTIGD